LDGNNDKGVSLLAVEELHVSWENVIDILT
jgi:hypothetical protein